jgi:hypothetical protein
MNRNFIKLFPLAQHIYRFYTIYEQDAANFSSLDISADSG